MHLYIVEYYIRGQNIGTLRTYIEAESMVEAASKLNSMHANAEITMITETWINEQLHGPEVSYSKEYK